MGHRCIHSESGRAGSAPSIWPVHMQRGRKRVFCLWKGLGEPQSSSAESQGMQHPCRLHQSCANVNRRQRHSVLLPGTIRASFRLPKSRLTAVLSHARSCGWCRKTCVHRCLRGVRAGGEELGCPLQSPTAAPCLSQSTSRVR